MTGFSKSNVEKELVCIVLQYRKQILPKTVRSSVVHVRNGMPKQIVRMLFKNVTPYSSYRDIHDAP